MTPKIKSRLFEEIVIYQCFQFQKIIFVIVIMDISQFESSTSNALLQIQKAQRVLDETELKMKMFKKQKECSSRYTTNIEQKSSGLPDLRQYISYLINEQVEPEDQQQSRKKVAKKLESASEVRGESIQRRRNDLNQLQNYKKTQKQDLKNMKFEALKDRTASYENEQFFDIKKHTQEQLQKSHVVRLQRIQIMYREQFQILDNKIQELLKNREKIKKDKVLLLRNNEELERQIDEQRERRSTMVKQNETNAIVNQLGGELLRLQKKISKIEAENMKIVKRKQDLQVNMRVCIRNSKQMLEEDINGTRLRPNKSKSAISYKCAYH